MKKLVFLFVSCVMAMTFASCNGNASKCNTPANDSDSVVVDTTVVDSLALVIDSAVAK